MKINANQKIISRSIRGENVVEAVFMPYDGENRCSKCIYAYDKKKCEKTPCTDTERKDGRNGYFRSGVSAESNYSINEGFGCI